MPSRRVKGEGGAVRLIEVGPSGLSQAQFDKMVAAGRIKSLDTAPATRKPAPEVSVKPSEEKEPEAKTEESEVEKPTADEAVSTAEAAPSYEAAPAAKTGGRKRKSTTTGGT